MEQVTELIPEMSRTSDLLQKTSSDRKMLQSGGNDKTILISKVVKPQPEEEIYDIYPDSPLREGLSQNLLSTQQSGLQMMHQKALSISPLATANSPTIEGKS